MKKLLVIVVCLLMAVSAFAKDEARADIYFVNGRVLENVPLKLPGSWYSKTEYYLDGKKQKVDSDSIDHMLIYHIDFPERKAYVSYNPIGKYDFKKNEIVDFKAKNWQMLESAGDNLLYWVSFWKVKVGKRVSPLMSVPTKEPAPHPIIFRSPPIPLRSTYRPISIDPEPRANGWSNISPTIPRSWNAYPKKVISASANQTSCVTAPPPTPSITRTSPLTTTP